MANSSCTSQNVYYCIIQSYSSLGLNRSSSKRLYLCREQVHEPCYERSIPKCHRIPTPFPGRVTTSLPVGTEPIWVVELTESIDNAGRKPQAGQDSVRVIFHIVRNTRQTHLKVNENPDLTQ
ncbi:hypothetical protein T11_10163 [Trichinella zimbabwensis]|uniref:Uncharacterized protein n=1 Tax=Trichinella zimbabwensis TaxID=268475 RepID=A0A0V1HKF7_9BILA|nr:hypothetical protein T11_10163 [Trichinella zimbabwensis]